MKFGVVFLIALGLCSIVQAATSVTCSVTDPDTNEVYDLSSLTKTSGEDWIAKDQLEQNEYIYRINICREILYTGTPYIQVLPLTSAHQVKVGTNRSHSIGTVASPVLLDGILTITSYSTDQCDSTGKFRQTTISFACDPDGAVGVPVFWFEDDCHYIFEWKTTAACPQTTSSGTSGVIVVLIILLVAVGMYFILGFLYNRCIGGKRGLEQLPNHRFWIAVANTLKCWSDEKVVHYRQLPRTADGVDEINPDEFDDDAIEKAEEQA